jgi:hypothetical protein
MALSMLAFYLGGWSDAIHWGAAEPRVRITPLGDVHMDHTFMDSVYEPFGRFTAGIDIEQARNSYTALYETPSERHPVANVFEPRFLDAWNAEFGISLQHTVTFMDHLEQTFVESPKPVVELSRSALAMILANAVGITSGDALHTLELITLAPRSAWRLATPPFVDKDWYPWRFRRWLSVLRRPFIQVDSGQDPSIVFAPALVRDALVSLIVRCQSGEILQSHVASAEMRKWLGHANNLQRTEFNSMVAARMQELGWRVQPEAKLTGLLGRRLERNYGDVDVFAWRPETGRILAIECKDLQFGKTLGEVAEQLSDFRGEIRADGKPDLLKKHLDRLDVLNANRATLAQRLRLNSPLSLEGHLVFRNPVPMQFAWKRMSEKIRLSLFSDLDRL